MTLVTVWNLQESHLRLLRVKGVELNGGAHLLKNRTPQIYKNIEDQIEYTGNMIIK